MRRKSGWNVPSSKMAANTVNKIRNIVENMVIKPNPAKHMIALSIGDPTTFDNLRACEEITEAVVTSVRSLRFNGYAPSTGYEEARAAVAAVSSYPGATLEPKDVILTSGCSHALDLCIGVLANPGQNVLVPRPGFPLYRTLAEGMGINTKFYNLMPQRNWEVDLEDLESQIDGQTAAIVVNNPSNPCGSVFSRQHLRAILDVAQRNYLPVIADEIYDQFVFPGHEFIPMASLSSEVPVLACGGLTKRYLVPGWRMGWILVHDQQDILSSVRKGLNNLCQRIIGSNTVIQGALPSILAETPEDFFEDSIAQVQANAELAYNVISKVPGLKPIMPAGAMYMMVGVDMDCFPQLKHDMDFVERLVQEQSVFCLPGMCFDYPNYFRIVLTVPGDQMQEACERIDDFCQMHYTLPNCTTGQTEVFKMNFALTV